MAEEVDADAAHVRIGDRQREIRRDGGIDGVAAVAQEVEATSIAVVPVSR